MCDVQVKQCNKCYRVKSVNDFGKHRLLKDGLQNTCRSCKSVIDKEYRIKTDYNRKNYVRINAKNRRARHKYQFDWKQYFINRYGKIVKCEICDTKLTFDTKNKKLAVHFDHRRGGTEPIETTPASWYTERPCNAYNIAIWKACDFGVLCGTCNILLPTKNRDEWLQKAIRYHEKTKGSLIN